MMKLIITESQLNELERSWTDKHFEGIFEKTKDKVVKSIISKLVAYTQNDKYLLVFGDGKKTLLSYNKESKELFYDRSLDDLYKQILPHPVWIINDKYYIHATFEKMFPDLEVKRVRSADIYIYL